MSSHITAPDREHLFQQVTHLALSEAAALLSASRSVELRIRLQSCRHDGWEALLSLQQGDAPLFCVSQTLRSPEMGVMLWLCEENDAQRLLLHLLGEDLPLGVMTEMEEEALVEVGNRLINRCLEHHAQLVPMIDGARPPRLWRGPMQELQSLLPQPRFRDEATRAELEFELGSSSLRGWLLWCGEPWRVAGPRPAGGTAA